MRMWKNIVQLDRPQMTVWRMRIPCWTPKATNAHFRNAQYALLFLYDSGCTNPPECYVIRKLPVLC